MISTNALPTITREELINKFGGTTPEQFLALHPERGYKDIAAIGGCSYSMVQKFFTLSKYRTEPSVELCLRLTLAHKEIQVRQEQVKRARRFEDKGGIFDGFLEDSASGAYG